MSSTAEDLLMFPCNKILNNCEPYTQESEYEAICKAMTYNVQSMKTADTMALSSASEGIVQPASVLSPYPKDLTGDLLYPNPHSSQHCTWIYVTETIGGDKYCMYNCRLQYIYVLLLMNS